MFDTVNHNILLYKLEFYGIKGECLSWFKSYLKDWQQFVSLCIYENSICGRITCGVPQCSILRPLFFLIYIHCLFRNSNGVIPIIFADQVLAWFSAVTCANEEKGSLGRQWKAHQKVKLHGLISPVQNSK